MNSDHRRMHCEIEPLTQCLAINPSVADVVTAQAATTLRRRPPDPRRDAADSSGPRSYTVNNGRRRHDKSHRTPHRPYAIAMTKDRSRTTEPADRHRRAISLFYVTVPIRIRRPWLCRGTKCRQLSNPTNDRRRRLTRDRDVTGPAGRLCFITSDIDMDNRSLRSLYDSWSTNSFTRNERVAKEAQNMVTPAIYYGNTEERDVNRDDAPSQTRAGAVVKSSRSTATSRSEAMHAKMTRIEDKMKKNPSIPSLRLRDGSTTRARTAPFLPLYKVTVDVSVNVLNARYSHKAACLRRLKVSLSPRRLSILVGDD
ncbi:hypothetical protein EVAR_96528_1 [Eumeta japonica]|uniref:Uncharacterized protein n=1 Tax=Eumeta variegata TaxID=151549 RepID=A0A4C1WDP3_EUMVA|nr:hypothetical protein EVAR_96528_1 [Eumeta japonica]